MSDTDMLIAGIAIGVFLAVLAGLLWVLAKLDSGNGQDYLLPSARYPGHQPVDPRARVLPLPTQSAVKPPIANDCDERQRMRKEIVELRARIERLEKRGRQS